MDLHKLLDTTADALKSDSILSRNTSILKSLPSFKTSSTVSTCTSYSQKDSDKDKLKELINRVTHQDVILSIIKKCVENRGTALDVNLKSKIEKIIKFHSFKASYEENNLNEILSINNKEVDLNWQDGEMRLTQKEGQELNKVIQKSIENIHTQIILEKRSSSSESSKNRLLQLQAKIQSKYLAIQSVMNSVDKIQDQMIHMSTVEYRQNVIHSNESVATTLHQIAELHDRALIGLNQKHAEETQIENTRNLLDDSLPATEDSLSTLESSIDSLQSDIATLESRLANYRTLESNPNHAAVFKTIRKLQKALQQKQFLLKLFRNQEGQE